MIYAKWLGLAVLSSALIQSEATSEQRHLGTSSSYNEHSAAIVSNDYPSNTCLTEAQCDKQRKKMGFVNERYFVSSDLHHHGCFYKNNNAFFGQGGTAAQKAIADLPGIQTRIWCDDWNDDGWKNGDYTDDDAWKEDGWKDDGYTKKIPSPTLVPAVEPTLEPSLEP